jgi:hypothetical protein
LLLTPDGPVSLAHHVGGFYDLTAGAAQARSNFTQYTGTYLHYDGTTPLQDEVHADFYNSGSANSELALTYTSFAMWRTRPDETLYGGQIGHRDDTYFSVFGVEPSSTFLAGMTGTATYSGVAYGAGVTNGGERYDIHGTSDFAVDFSGGTYSGSLHLSGTDAASATRDFGSFDFASTLGGGGFTAAVVPGPDPNWGQVVSPHFYGPQGQEIGATFNLITGLYADPATVQIDGVALAKKK